MLDCLHERIGRGRLENRMAERQIDHVDAERFLFTIANSIARTTFAVSPWPFALRTLRPISRALGATPTNSPLRPATCVPWP